MYNWRILSFVTFSSFSWIVSMAVASAVWMALSAQPAPQAPPPEKDESEGVKSEESEDEVNLSSSSSTEDQPHTQTEKEKAAIKKEEEIEESTMIEPLSKDLREGTSTQFAIPGSGSGEGRQRRKV
jgi:cytoskeletal protein RodZ